MVAPRLACDNELLQRVLRGLASQLELADVETHVSECVACQKFLEDSSGGHDFAVTTRRMLPLRNVPEQVAGQESQMALPFLLPSNDPKYVGMLGPYYIESVLGQGGFGVVLKGWDSQLNRFVAIKVLANPLLNSAVSKQRFAREAQAAAAIAHDAVVPIYAVESTGPIPYLVLGFVPGPSLERYLQQHGTLEPIRVVRIALQIAQGLAAAHAQGIVHRDIKPGNILMSGELDRIKIADFGLARVVDDASQTQSGLIMGTPQYMSPEQARGECVDTRSDLFSLGSVMYAMCCGHSPFRAETTFGVLRRISDESPRDIREHNADVPLELASIIHGLLQKQVDQRIASAPELAELLQAYLAMLQQPTKRRTDSPFARQLSLLMRSLIKERTFWQRTNRLLKRAALGVGVLLLCGGIAWWGGNFFEGRTVQRLQTAWPPDQQQPTLPMPPSRAEQANRAATKDAWQMELSSLESDLRNLEIQWQQVVLPNDLPANFERLQTDVNQIETDFRNLKGSTR